MPTYEYACKDCGEHLEVVQSFHDDALTECPTCHGTLRKVFSAAGIIFKGSGWHSKDYAASRPGGADGGNGSSGSSEGDGTSSSESSSSDSSSDSGTSSSSGTSSTSGTSSSSSGGDSPGGGSSGGGSSSDSSD